MERKVIAYQKKNILHFFKDLRAIEMADFIATKIEGTETYYVHKIRRYVPFPYFSNGVVNLPTFLAMLSLTQRPIVLSSMYIDLEEELKNG